MVCLRNISVDTLHKGDTTTTTTTTTTTNNNNNNNNNNMAKLREKQVQ
jgi:hypothetical protein